MNLFGKAKAKPTPSSTGGIPSSSAPGKDAAINAIQSLRDQLDILEKREVLITKKIEIALNEVKLKSAQKNKQGEREREEFFFLFSLMYFQNNKNQY